ncbi:MAG: class I SAM-dependent methyltransferase [Planctomycetes bacterium]|nr:class I SAM-dependent methyltransferase [Planctomycetota bacterium]
MSMQEEVSALREVPCLFCGVHDEKIRFHDGVYRVVECRRCGHVYVNPRLPTERLHEMYQEEYWTSERAKEFGYTQYLAERPLYLRTYAMRSALIDAYVARPGAVLDVGCAAGFFLKVMHDKGWRTTGIEISKPMVEYARGELGLPDMRRGDLLTVELPERAYDVITLWDVIEHLEDPGAHLARAHQALADDGILVLETQNVASRFARLLGPKWQHYKHEEHLYHFHPETLERLLREAGFRLVENTPKRGGKYVSMGFLVERVGRLHPLLSVLASPLKVFSGASLYVNLRDEMVAVAKKA